MPELGNSEQFEEQQRLYAQRLIDEQNRARLAEIDEERERQAAAEQDKELGYWPDQGPENQADLAQRTQMVQLMVAENAAQENAEDEDIDSQIAKARKRAGGTSGLYYLLLLSAISADLLNLVLNLSVIFSFLCPAVSALATSTRFLGIMYANGGFKSNAYSQEYVRKMIRRNAAFGAASALPVVSAMFPQTVCMALEFHYRKKEAGSASQEISRLNALKKAVARIR